MQRDTALAAIPGSIGRRIPPQSTRRLHADDIGTLISQQHARKRSCDILAKIDDPNAVEYTGHTFPPLHEVPSHPGEGIEHTSCVTRAASFTSGAKVPGGYSFLPSLSTTPPQPCEPIPRSRYRFMQGKPDLIHCGSGMTSAPQQLMARERCSDQWLSR